MYLEITFCLLLFSYTMVIFFAPKAPLVCPKPNKPNKKLTMQFVTLETRSSPEILEMVKIHNDNIEKYVGLHSEYKYLFTNSFKSNLSPYWQKFLILRQLLQTSSAEVVVWLDSDVIFRDLSFRFDEIILKSSASIFIGSEGWFKNNLNCGVMFLCNNDTSRAVLDDCLYTYLGRKTCFATVDGLNSVWAGKCFEQGILNELYQKKYRCDIQLFGSEVSNCTDITDSPVNHIHGPKKPALLKMQKLRRDINNKHIK